MALSGWLKWLPFGKVPEIAPQKLQALLTQSAVQIIDVRTEEEWRRSRIPGALNLPITQFSRANIDALQLRRDAPVVAICLSAHRSIPAVRQLQAMGFAQVYQLQQGMRQWWQLRMPCEQD